MSYDSEAKGKGLKRLRAVKGKDGHPAYHCDNCGCDRHSPCGCKRKGEGK